MDQVSLPMRIALLVTLAFAGLWFVALRPKPPGAPAPAPPAAASQPASAPGEAKAVAEDAAATPDAAGTAAPSAAQGAAAPPAESPAQAQPGAIPQADSATPAASQPAVAPGGKTVSGGKTSSRERSVRRVLADMDGRKVVVLLFWDRGSADDREVRRAVARVDRHRGKVAVHTASIADLADFEAITRGVPVVTSPTVLVIDRARQARAIGGLTVTRELDASVTKALRVRP